LCRLSEGRAGLGRDPDGAREAGDPAAAGESPAGAGSGAGSRPGETCTGHRDQQTERNLVRR
ncbi:MAG: hypothetical protein OEW13_07905, partial [Nitrospira sp.]|nr:hypothetical protein [Nitrospira sp.]